MQELNIKLVPGKPKTRNGFPKKQPMLDHARKPSRIAQALLDLKEKGEFPNCFRGSNIRALAKNRAFSDSLQRILAKLGNNRGEMELLGGIIKSRNFSMELMPLLERVSNAEQKFSYKEGNNQGVVDTSDLIHSSMLSSINGLVNSNALGASAVKFLNAIAANTLFIGEEAPNPKSHPIFAKSEDSLKWAMHSLNSISANKRFSKDLAPLVEDILHSGPEHEFKMEMDLLNMLISNDRLAAMFSDRNVLRGAFFDISDKIFKCTLSIEEKPERLRAHLELINLVSHREFGPNRLSALLFILSRLESSKMRNKKEVNECLMQIKRYLFSPWMREPFMKSPIMILLDTPHSEDSLKAVDILEAIASHRNFNRKTMSHSIELLSRKVNDGNYAESYRRLVSVLDSRHFNKGIIPIADMLFRKMGYESFGEVFGFMDRMLGSKSLANGTFDDSMSASLVEIVKRCDPRNTMKALNLAAFMAENGNFNGKMRKSFMMMVERARDLDLYLAMASLNAILLSNPYSERLSSLAGRAIAGTTGSEISVSLDLLCILLGKKNFGMDRISEKEVDSIIRIAKGVSALEREASFMLPSTALCRLFESENFGPEGLGSLASMISNSSPKELVAMLRNNQDSGEPDAEQLFLNLFEHNIRQ